MSAQVPTLKSLALITQKEYMFNHTESGYQAIGTESVRGCYAITIYHPSKQAIIHWDDNTKRNQLDKLISEFLVDMTSQTCTVNLAGGWRDHKESANTGEYLKAAFEDKGFKVTLHGYQEKTDQGDWSAQGYSRVILNCVTGEIDLSDNWDPACRIVGEYGPDIEDVFKTICYLDNTHLQDNRFKDSGSSLIPRDEFKIIQKKGAIALCKAAKENNIDKLIQEIDDGITHIDTPAAAGWTALHYACFMKNFRCARILIENGASIEVKTDKGNTPLQLIKDNPSEVEKLKTLFKVIQINLRINPAQGLLAFSLFSRHPDRLDRDVRDEIENLETTLNTKQGVAKLNSMFTS